MHNTTLKNDLLPYQTKKSTLIFNSFNLLCVKMSFPQQSYSTFDRLTPTISEELRFARNSPRARAFLEEDARQTAFTKRDKVIERIRIPSSTSVNTKSGSVEIGKKLI